jgi:hypothetical protein
MNRRAYHVTAVTLLCCALPLSVLLMQRCVAHDSNHPEFDSWYRGLKNPHFKSAVIQDLGVAARGTVMRQKRTSAVGVGGQELVNRISNMVNQSLLATPNILSTWSITRSPGN